MVRVFLKTEYQIAKVLAEKNIQMVKAAINFLIIIDDVQDTFDKWGGV